MSRDSSFDTGIDGPACDTQISTSPMLDLYIEVRSLDRGYDTDGRRVRRKNRLYRESGVNWIEVDPAYTAWDGQCRLKSQRAIERDLTKRINRYTGQSMPGYPFHGRLDDVLEHLAWPSTYRSKRWGKYLSGSGSRPGRYRSGGGYRGGRGGTYR